MSDIVSPLLQWLNAHPEWAGIATFVISAAESIAIIGTIIPGSITMTAIGALAGAGVIPLWQTIFLAMLGAIVGDSISYWLGYYFKDSLRRIWPFRTNPGVLVSGEAFVQKYGVMSVFIGRFVGPVRALVPLVAGMLGMKPLQFTIANVTSAIGWAPAYMLPGILLGAASLELPPDIAVHVMLVLLMIMLFSLLLMWVAYKLFQLVNVQTAQLLTSIWNYLKKRRRYAPVTYMLRHHDKKISYGQLNRAFLLFLTGSLFLVLVGIVKHYGAAHLFVNDAVFHLFRGIRSENLDQVMLYITLLGQKQVIMPVIAVLFAWLIIAKRWRIAAHALALGILASGSVFVLKRLIKSPRPWGIADSPDTFSMPSGHSTLSFTIYMGLAFLIALSVRESRRGIVYAIAFLIPLGVAISRLYLNAHWFTDIISAWLLSAALLLTIMISYQRKSEKPVSPWGILLITLVTLSVTYTTYYHYNAKHLQAMYAQSDWPTATIKMDEWWNKNVELPAYRTSLFGFPSQKINIEWVGSIEDIRQTLTAEGWETPPARNWVSTVHRIADVKSAQYLSLISPQYLDKKPELTLSRRTNKSKNLLVLRLWHSNRTIIGSNAPIWIGTIGLVPRSYSWLFRKNPGEVTIDPEMVFPTSQSAAKWEINTVWVHIPSSKKDSANQKIILIRPAKNNE